MATRADELTREIEVTRTRMDRTIDGIGERAGPGRLRQRMAGAMQNTKATVMGAVSDGDDGATSAGGAAAGTRNRSEGNPIAAGLIAFGAGLLAGSVMPGSRTENELAREVQRKAQAPVRESLQESASELSDRISEKAAEAKERVAQELSSATDDIAGEARGRAQDVEDHAQDAASEVRDDVAGTTRHHTGR